MAVSDHSEFVALAQPGNEHYAGLETFANPGVGQVELASDELRRSVRSLDSRTCSRDDRFPAGRALPRVEVAEALPDAYRNEGVFCEELAVRIRDDVARRSSWLRSESR